MRHIRKVGMWPVGLISKYGVSSPIVANGTISGFYDGWIGGRKYPIDMAGFAVSVKFLLSRPKAEMPFKAGYEEDGFLRSLDPLDMKEIDLLASNCTEVGIDGVTLKIKSFSNCRFHFRFSRGTRSPRKTRRHFRWTWPSTARQTWWSWRRFSFEAGRTNKSERNCEQNDAITKTRETESLPSEKEY